MDAPKRTRSPAESERRGKKAKTSHESGNDAAAQVPGRQQQHGSEVQVSIKFRSTSKAIRNDPYYWDNLSWSAVSDGDARSRSSVSSDSCPPHPPTPVPPESSAAPGGPGSLAPVDDPRRRKDDSVDGRVGERSCGSSRAHSDEEEQEEEEDDDDDDLGYDTGYEDPYADEYSDCDSNRSSWDEFAEWKWLEQIDGVGDVDHHQVASCDAKLIRRQGMRSAFWTEMEEPSSETSDLAFELFDRYGRLNREHYDHEMGKGSGVWGQELDHGDILLFETLSVETIWRHQGIGTKLVKAVLDKVRAKSYGFFAFARPGYLIADLPSASKEGNSEPARKLLEVSTLFWRSLGFRRVGTSGWFAFTNDAHHPSRRLEAAQDWDEPEHAKEEESIPERMQTILCALADPSASDVECVRQIQEALPVEATALSQPYTDERGNTILHIAALGRKPEAIAYLLAKYPRSAGMRNARGHTPLDVLQGSLEEYRTRRCWGGATAVMSDEFGGFSLSDLACLAALTDTMVFDLAKVSTEDISAISSATDREAGRIRDAGTIRHTLRLKYGCTCGECVGGFLSPRMRFALLCQAELQHDMLRAGLHGSGPDWVAINRVALRHLAAPVRQNLETNKSMRRGFTNMCHHIARCLRERRLPNEETVLRLFRDGRGGWPAVTKHYLQRGGTVAAVATMLFDRAMHQDEWAGNGAHLESHQEKISRLPVCRNDHEFGFVSGMCGYKRVLVVQYEDMFG